LKGSGERIKSLQRGLSHKKKGSKNRKAKPSLAEAWRKVRRQRDDFAHKLSDQLTKENKVIVFEDLRIGNMVKNHNLASAIMDSAWGGLRQLTVYKAERRGRRVILVEPRGTSQKCSRCGEAVPKEPSESSRLPEVRAGHGQGCECRTKRPEAGPGTGPRGGAASICPTKEDEQVRSCEAGSSWYEDDRLQPWVVHRK
jgi:putative transposase